MRAADWRLNNIQLIVVHRTIYKNVCLNRFSTFLGWLLYSPHPPRVWHIFLYSLNWSINQNTFDRTSISISHHSSRYFYRRKGVHRTLSIISQAKSCQGLQLGLKQNTLPVTVSISHCIATRDTPPLYFNTINSPHLFRKPRLVYYVNVTLCIPVLS